MSDERRELPDGYSWQECPSLKLAIPKPTGWFYRYEEAPGTKACFVTRERIIATRGWNVPIDQEGGFRVGLHLNCLSSFQGRTGISPGKFAKDAITTNPALVPIGEVERISQNPFVIYRGPFRIRVSFQSELRELMQFVQAVGNMRTGSAYLMGFETPSEEWEQYKDIGEMMIKNVALHPSI